MAKRLIYGSMKADPNMRDSTGYTPLIKAATDGHIAMVELLIDSGAEIDAAEPN
jgi:ankyrin repeat protein